MNLREYLLACVGEEGTEVAKDVSKALRFGEQDRNVLDPTGPTNLERVVAELNDLLGTVQLLVTKGVLPADWQNAGAQAAKRRKLATFMGYALAQGTLELPLTTTREWHTFEAWCAHVRDIAHEYGFDPAGIPLTTADHWRGFYESGFDPEHAFLEDERAAKAALEQTRK